ncbi:MAG: PP2C family protein-serine/threonine phosphatase, partial [Phycisphaerae bacterium]
MRRALNEAETEAKLESLRHDLDIAKKIQEGLFPKTPPETPGYDIAGWSKPADQTGGDYYDWIALPNGRLAVMLGDVTGHGIGPALLMAICRAYTRATFPSQMELQEAMRRLNALLSEDVGEGRFITFAVAVLDPATGEVEVLSAGHGPILLRRTPGGTCSLAETEGTGLPLGIMPEEDSGAPLRWKLE